MFEHAIACVIADIVSVFILKLFTIKIEGEFLL